jgi:hypothetical protein
MTLQETEKCMVESHPTNTSFSENSNDVHIKWLHNGDLVITFPGLGYHFLAARAHNN